MYPDIILFKNILILFKLFSSVNDRVDASDASMSFQDEEQFLISAFDTIVQPLYVENWNFVTFVLLPKRT